MAYSINYDLEGGFYGPLTAVCKGWKRYQRSEIADISILVESTNSGNRTAAAVGGALLFGVAGALVGGAAAKGRSVNTSVLVKLISGQSFVLEGTHEQAIKLLNAWGQAHIASSTTQKSPQQKRQSPAVRARILQFKLAVLTAPICLLILWAEFSSFLWALVCTVVALIGIAYLIFRNPIRTTGRAALATSGAKAAPDQELAEPFAFGKLCLSCNEQLMNAARKCPKCGMDLGRHS